jgi:hypothetical protein
MYVLFTLLELSPLRDPSSSISSGLSEKVTVKNQAQWGEREGEGWEGWEGWR